MVKEMVQNNVMMVISYSKMDVVVVWLMIDTYVMEVVLISVCFNVEMA